MTFELVNVLEFDCYNYKLWKINMVDVLRAINLCWLVNGDIQNPIDAT
jgi:hypothetical protein